jgi:CRP-like cAMP-binding protein
MGECGPPVSQGRRVTESGAGFYPDPPELADLLQQFPARRFDRGDILIENTYGQAGHTPTPALAYVAEGLVRGVRNHSMVAPRNRSTVVIAGDGRWIGFDAFKFGENLLRYVALTHTAASVLPMEHVRKHLSEGILLHILQDVSLQWWTVASVMSLGNDTLERRTLLLLCDLRRLHARPEIEVRQRDIADLLGVARQTLHPVLKNLEKAGLLSLGYAEITIGDAAPLLQALVAIEEETSMPDEVEEEPPAEE